MKRKKNDLKNLQLVVFARKKNQAFLFDKLICRHLCSSVCKSEVQVFFSKDLK